MRVHLWQTDSGVVYAHTDGTRATKAEWIAQCKQGDEEARQRATAERERKAQQVYSDEPVRYQMGRQGGYSVDAMGNANNGLIFR